METNAFRTKHVLAFLVYVETYFCVLLSLAFVGNSNGWSSDTEPLVLAVDHGPSQILVSGLDHTCALFKNTFPCIVLRVSLTLAEHLGSIRSRVTSTSTHQFHHLFPSAVPCYSMWQSPHTHTQTTHDISHTRVFQVSDLSFFDDRLFIDLTTAVAHPRVNQGLILDKEQAHKLHHPDTERQ